MSKTRTGHATRKKAKALMQAEGLSYAQALAQVRAGESGNKGLLIEAVATTIREAWAKPGPSPTDLLLSNQGDWLSACKELALKGDPTKSPYMKVKAGSEVAKEVGLPDGGRVRISGVGARETDGEFRPHLQVEDQGGYRYWVYLTHENAGDISFR